MRLRAQSFNFSRKEFRLCVRVGMLNFCSFHHGKLDDKYIYTNFIHSDLHLSNKATYKIKQTEIVMNENG